MTPEERRLVEVMTLRWGAQMDEDVSRAPELTPERAAQVRRLLGEGATCPPR